MLSLCFNIRIVVINAFILDYVIYTALGVFL